MMCMDARWMVCVVLWVSEFRNCNAVCHLQDVFLDQTREYYAAEGARLMSELDVADYLLHCEVKYASHSQSICLSNGTLRTFDPMMSSTLSY
jgi:hypothetical protein